ncbi:UDP-galactose transporter and 9 transmembrane domains [Cryptosporidium sp. chipmunk genotype I]|uniref:UDP-galactose transporter and 9 transmembrane domains n=1 Tax=Cryptosporidium sp. chipmunk genotype I TaxID=1280935 RepID=UPI00351AB082|nr:UDP-galactose transporter and 9 transmembrane domains [Cryptosporidium sp. chipmunk genotype I]
MSDTIIGAFCVTGIYFFFILYGIVQERIHALGDKRVGDNFNYSLFLVFCFCLVNTIVSLGIIQIENWRARPEKENTFGKSKNSNSSNKISVFNLSFECIFQILLTSVTYLTAMVLTNLALGKVNYPTQVLVKSAKCVPIIAIGTLYFKTKYPWYDYLAVIVITVSLSCFNMMQIKTNKVGTVQTLSGVSLLGISLLCDGLTGPRQDKLIKKYNVTSNVLMFYTNLFAMVLCGILSLIFEGQEPYLFISRFPSTPYYILALSLTGTCGQFFIFQSLIRFGSLYLAIITTTRKFFTVLVSVVIFGHKLSLGQWLCVSAIFAVLGIQTVFSRKNKEKLKTK